MQQWKERYIGDKEFYKMVVVLALPILIQNGITNFVSLLDNIMVGQLGTEQMSGIAIVNQIMNVYYVCLFGAVSGTSIFSSQYFGQGNHEGVRNTFRFKVLCCAAMAVIWLLIMGFGGSGLIQLFLNDDAAQNVLMTHQAGMSYLRIMMIGMVPYMIMQVYASTLREIGQTFLPMVCSMAAVVVNLCINYVLIFGHFGMPKLGVSGAAIGTVIARFVEMGIVVLWTHTHKSKAQFIKGAYKNFAIPRALVGQIFKKGMPLLVNETLWSAGQAILVQCYSMRGLNAVAALNISTTVSNLFNIVFIALGSAIAIVVGQQLGAGQLERAVETDRKLIFFSVVSCVGIGAVLFLVAPLFPEIYNTSDQVRNIAGNLIRISAVFMPLYAFYHASYFTLRTGGKTIITFLFDSCYVWAVNIPLAFFLSRMTGLDIIVIFFLCQCVEILKAVLGVILLKKGVWVNNIVAEI